MRLLFVRILAVAIAFLLIEVSCSQDFGKPSTPADVLPVVNTSIRALKSMHVQGAFEKITADLVIGGTVVADDRSGNFYKEIIIQDSSGGIVLRLEQSNLFINYPVGRKVVIICNGLYLGDYGRLVQLGGGIDRSDPSSPALAGIIPSLFAARLFKGPLDNPPAPRPVTMQMLTASMQDSFQSTLVRLDKLEFAETDLDKRFADTTRKLSALSYGMKDCQGNSITLRSSSYASFAGATLPSGNGSVTAIASVYGTTRQLIIRDTSDIRFTENRCSQAAAIFTEDFEKADTTEAALKSRGWQNLSEKGNTPFTIDRFGDNHFARISGFGSGQAAIRSWLLTPRINGSGNYLISFKTIDGYDNGASLKVYTSQDYKGSGNPWSAGTWTLLPAKFSSGHASGYASVWVASGNLVQPGGSFFLAFVYEGADPAGSSGDRSTTFEIDEIRVVQN